MAGCVVGLKPAFPTVLHTFHCKWWLRTLLPAAGSEAPLPSAAAGCVAEWNLMKSLSTTPMASFAMASCFWTGKGG